MVVRADILEVRPAAASSALQPAARVADIRAEATARLTQIAIGQQVQATVASLFTDGSVLLKVADSTVRTNLPAGAKVGDQLQLTLLRTDPRLTFGLDAESGAAPTTLSPAARLIDQLLQSSSATTLVGKTPVVASGATAPAQIATALQNTLSSSGLFYESHVQQWLNGSRPLADLLREPQNQPASGSGAAPAEGALARDNASLPSLASAHAAALGKTDVAGIADGTLQATATRTDPLTGKQIAATLDAAAKQPDLALNPDNARIVNLQLNTLEQPRVQWRGEVWPGQQLEWEVSQNQDQPEHGTRDETQRPWQSVVRFALPTLGRIAATITLVGDHVQVQVRTADPASADTLRSYGRQLANALDAAGSTLDSLIVKQDPQA
ncbi:hypothetical protein RCH09_002530 [Actimicrobium sp. GrIS 1.19]|uniref:flagellar hook-length control protein FliK n=1 Tax=Actimicrobium sp. GrIS 1.19 TaxID=3071708 RepID=UPI002DFDA4BF|nr:hypothetical protein [Actimicrobium sp. GrIS 1.19]